MNACYKTDSTSGSHSSIGQQQGALVIRSGNSSPPEINSAAFQLFSRSYWHCLPLRPADDVFTHQPSVHSASFRAFLFLILCWKLKSFFPCKIRGSQCGGYEDFCLLRYKAVQYVESQPMFRRNMSPPSSGSKNKPTSEPPYIQIYNWRPRHCLKWSFIILTDTCFTPISCCILGPWRWRRNGPPKRRLTLNGLHGVISQNSLFLSFSSAFSLSLRSVYETSGPSGRSPASCSGGPGSNLGRTPATLADLFLCNSPRPSTSCTIHYSPVI
jgi:hypothetical protein